MSASNKVYYRNFLTMLSGNTLSQLIPFIIAPILSRIFSPEEFAVLANFMAIVGVIGIISTGRLELAVPIPQDHKKAQEIVFTGLIITLLLGVLSVLIPIFAYQISALYKDDQLAGYLWMVPFSVVSFGLLGLTNNWNLRQEKFHLLSIGKIAQSVVNNGLAALLGYIGWGINGLIISWLLSQYVNIFILLVGVNRKVSYKDF
jgi:O-antigen/teichoic acid export membrane protein